MVPKRVFFTKGAGKHKHKLQSFELALRDAGIERYNIVNVSSIIPPNCQIITPAKGIDQLKVGQITHCVMSRNDTQEPNRLIGAGIGIAIPKEKNSYGYISEHHSYGDANKKLGDHAEDLAATMLATTLGLEFDPDKAWSEKEQAYKSSGLFIKTTNITQTAKGQEGLWTTTVALAMFLFD